MKRKESLLLACLFLACLIIGFLIGFVLEACVAVGPSMEPTFSTGDLLVLSKVFFSVENGDVVAIEHEGKLVTKRIAFMEGQQAVVDGVSYDYWGSATVPDGYCFVLGDNRAESLDSRSPEFGLIAMENIYAKFLRSFRLEG